jgi:hypothetical protein
LPLISVSSQVVQSSLSQLPIVPSPSPTLPRAVVRTTQVAVASTKLVPSPTPAVPPMNPCHHHDCPGNMTCRVMPNTMKAECFCNTSTMCHHHHQSHSVCGSDGRTYTSECELEKEAECRHLHIVSNGTCPTTGPTAVATTGTTMATTGTTMAGSTGWSNGMN